MKTTLDHVDDTTFSLMTLDGKEYKIEPADVTICCAWTVSYTHLRRMPATIASPGILLH